MRKTGYNFKILLIALAALGGFSFSAHGAATITGAMNSPTTTLSHT